MKNLFLLIVAFVLSSFVLGQTTLFFDNFETNTGWTLTGEFQRDQPQGLGGNSLGYPDPATAFSGDYVLGDDLTGLGLNLGDYENDLADRADKAESPTFDCSGYANIILNFQRWLGVEQPLWDRAYIDVSNDNGTSWTNVWQNGDDIFDNAWSLHSVNISAVANDQAQVKIRFCIGPTDASMHCCGWNLDDVEVTGILSTNPPSCTTPVYPSNGANNIEVSGNLEWNIEPIATGYKIWFGTNGGGIFNPTNIENGTDLGNVTSYSFSGLDYSTIYYWRIIPYNAIGDAVGCSIWSFTTPIPVVTPSSEDFETFTVANNATGYTNGWGTSPSNTTYQFRWNVNNGGTQTSNTGPEVDHTTGTASGIYLFTKANSGSTGSDAYVYSPIYDLSTLTDPQIKFWYHMYGYNMGELHLDIDAGSGWVNDVATPLIGQQQTAQDDPWLKMITNLSAYSGQIVKFRFRGIRGNGSRSDMAIDDVSIEETPTCPAPSGLITSNITLTTADLDWTENGPATTWEVEWGPTGFTQGSGTTITDITNHPYTLNPPLSPATTYDWYVRSVCSVGDTSVWEGPEIFTTLCNPFTAPFSENFDAVTPPDLPNCWYKIVEFVYAYIKTDPTSSYSPPNSIVMYSSYYLSGAVILATPQLSDLTSQSNQIRFYAKSDQQSDVIIGTMSDPLNVATFTAYQTINLTPTYTEYIVTFGAIYTSTDEYIAFKHGGSSCNTYINIDDFVYEAMPACPKPVFIYADNIELTTATLNWTENGTATTWNIEVGEPGFTPGTGTAIQTHTGIMLNPFNISNLTQGTTYDFYIQADCGGGSTSTWEGASFTTVPLGVNCTNPYMMTDADLPFSQAGMTTCGFGDDYSNADACNSYYMDGDDLVFEYTPVDNININIVLTNTLDYTGVFVTNGCPDVGTCAYYDEQVYGDPALYNIALTGGTTYYIIVSTWPTPQCTDFDIDISEFEEQNIVITGGWSGISSYINPLDENIENIFEPIINELIILQNETGMYWPAQSVNTLGTWDTHAGYKIKVTENVELTITGGRQGNTTIDLSEGWNLIPVLSVSNVNVVDLFAGCDLIIVKDVAGNGVYWPGYNVNTLVNLEPGKSYFVYMNSPGSITFNISSDNIILKNPAEFANLSPWNDIHHTPGTHIVAFDAEAISVFETDDIIGAFTESGLCAGMIAYSENGAAIVLNGDDIYTSEIDGFVSDEIISYRLYRPSTGEIFDLEVEYAPTLDNSGLFSFNSMSAITGVTLQGFQTLEGLDNRYIRIYPNPSDGKFNIFFKGLNGNVIANISDFRGNEYYRLEFEGIKANTTKQINLSELSAGVYFISFTGDDFSQVKKIVIK